ncbi:MAG: shikimate kinase [Candidatus Omnitrophica bacterium]|nr:shikimate kinase [Candidatus Omnitrophota bacterium]
MENVYFVGFMGSGKTTVARLLADKLGKGFLEMDSEIEKSAGMSIVEIFEGKGQDYFRDLESKLLADIAKRSDLVVSCGGGLVCRQENIDLLKKSGKLVNLSASADEIYKRVKNDNSRPLLKVADPQNEIVRLLKIRQEFYEQADITIDTDSKTPEDVLEEILKVL